MFKKICLLFFAIIIMPSISFGEIKTIFADHEYIMGDNDSKNDARQMCFLEAKRKVLEKAGTYIKSHTQIKNFRLTRDEINIYSAALLQVETIKEEWKFVGKNMAVFMTVKAVVDSRSVDEQLLKIEKDISVQKNIKEQQNKLKELEETVRLLQRQISNETSLKKSFKKPIIIDEKTLNNSQKTLTLRKKRAEILKEIDDVEKRYKYMKAEINLRRGHESERKKEEERKSRVLGQNILKYVEIGMTPKEVEYILGKPDKKITPFTDIRKKFNLPMNIVFLRYGHYNIICTDTFTDNLTVQNILFQFPEKSKELQFAKHRGDTNCLHVYLKHKSQQGILDIRKDGIRHINYKNGYMPYPPECLSYLKRYFGDYQK